MENQVVELAQADSLNQSIRPRPIEYQKIVVQLNASTGILHVFAKELYSNLALTRENELPFTEEQFLRYCEYIIRWRIKIVNNGANQAGLLHPRSEIVVPAVLSQLTKQIGRVVIVDAGAEVWPEDATDTPYLSKDEVLSLSNKLRFFMNQGGFEYAEGLSRDTRGGYDFMLTMVRNDNIESPNPEMPGIVAMLAAFTMNQCSRTIFAPIVHYGTLDEMKMLVRVLAAPKG